MAEKSSGQSDHLHCVNCAKLKDTHCEQIKIALDECSAFKEEVRIEKEQAVVKELKEAKTKINKLQRTLSAFQIAITVGVTILGQEAFDKIFGKVEEVQKVQEKINGIIPEEKQKSSTDSNTSETKKSKKVTDAFTLNRINILDYIQPTQIGLGLGPISEAKIVITQSEPANIPWLPVTPESSTTTKIPVIVDPPVQPFLLSKTKELWEMSIPVTAENVNSWIAPPVLDFFDDQGTVYANFNTLPIPQASAPSVFVLLGLAGFMLKRRRT